MDKGYVKLWRKSIDSGMIQNHELWAFWCWCLMKAAHKPVKVMVGFQEVNLLPGQFVFGRKSASLQTRISERTIRTCLKNLENMKNLTIKPTNKFSIITILNWDTYQCEKEKPTSKATINRPTSDQQVTTNKNEKNEKNEKNTNKPLCDYLQSKIQNGLVPFQEKIIEFFNYRQSKPAKDRYASEKGIDGLFRDMEACRKAGYSLTACLDISMERGWKTPSAEYFEKIKHLVVQPGQVSHLSLSTMSPKQQHNARVLAEIIQEAAENECRRNG